MNAVVVIPTNRPERVAPFLEAWRQELEGARIILVYDVYDSPAVQESVNAETYCWTDIDRELGDSAWVIPRRSDCVRSFGFLKALESAPDMIVTLDDDCSPQTPNFLAEHWTKLNALPASECWTSTISGPKPRGFPYHHTTRAARVILNHGLWGGIPDLDAVTKLRGSGSLGFLEQVVPRGHYFPMSGMNLAFRPELAPAMYFGLQGPDYPFARFGDIWAGVLAKKVLDHLGCAVTSGQPYVFHERASNIWANLAQEAPGLEANETFWQRVDEMTMTADTITTSYRQLAVQLSRAGGYWKTLASAMLAWTDLCAKASDSQNATT